MLEHMMEIAAALLGNEQKAPVSSQPVKCYQLGEQDQSSLIRKNSATSLVKLAVHVYYQNK